MTITFHLLEAFLKCPTKCWLRSAGEQITGGTFAQYTQTQDESYRRLRFTDCSRERTRASVSSPLLRTT